MPKAYNIDTIFNKYKNKVYRLALSITRNERDAEDVMQNTFLKIIRNLKYFRNKSQISTWIYRITYNEALMYLRKRKRQLKLSNTIRQAKEKKLGLFINWPKLPDKYLLEGELKMRVDESIRNLPIKYRMPLLLDNVEQLPLKSSANILNLNLNSLKTRLHRARLIIKSEIQEYFNDRIPDSGKNEEKCSRWTGFVYRYALGNLGKRSGQAFKKHIGDCPSCNSFLDNYVAAIHITGALECKDLPQDLKIKIASFIKKHRENLM